MSIAELSPGDKLSLKGKLFELQRKLSLVELEQSQEPECSFRPAITDFELPDRHPEYTENVRRAEEARKERLRSLQATLQREHDESHTFSPRLVARHVRANKVPHAGRAHHHNHPPHSQQQQHHAGANKPVYERLYEKGVEYRQKHEERKERAKNFDFDGRRLFAPSLPPHDLRCDLGDDGKNRNRHPGDGSSSTGGDAASQSAAEEYEQEGAGEGHQYPPPPPPDLDDGMRSSRLSSTTASRASKPKEDAGNVVVQDFLYRDALDRNERLAMLRESVDEEAVKLANQSKLNKRSEALLRQKYDRQVREGLDIILRMGPPPTPPLEDGQQEPPSDGNSNNNISLNAMVELSHVQGGVIAICNRDLWAHEDGKSVAGGSNDPYKLAALIWEALGRQEWESIDSKAFVDRSLSAMMSKKKGKVDVLCHFIDRLQLLIQEFRNEAQDAAEEDERRRQEAQRGKPKFRHLKNAPKPSLSREERTAMLRKQLADQEKSECTFKPTIFTRNSFAALNLSGESHVVGKWPEEVDYSYGSHNNHSSNGKSRFERLYALKDKVPESIAMQKHKSFQERDMEGCTFAPNVPHRTPSRASAPSASSGMSEEDVSVGDASSSHASPARTPSTLPKGFIDSVERARVAREMRLRKEQSVEDTTAFSEERYQKSRKLAAEGPKPFSFHSEERPKRRPTDGAARTPEQTPEAAAKARLYIDVNLGDGMKGKVPKIAVSDWDDPASLSKDFCRIYGLDADAEKILTQVIFQNMRRNGVHVFGDQEVEVDVAGSDSDGRSP